MKIIQVSKRFVTDEGAGREAFFAETSRRLIEQGVSSEIFAAAVGSSLRQEQFLNVSVHRFPCFYPKVGLSREEREKLDKLGGDPFSFALKRALSKRKDTDVLHISAGSRLGSMVRSAAGRRKIPYVVSLTGEFFVFPNSRTGASEAHAPREAAAEGSLDWGKPLDLLYGSGRVLDEAEALICSGRDDFTAASRRYPDKKVIFLPDGVDMRRFSNADGQWFRRMYRIPAERCLILSVGKIDPQKNQLTLIRQLPDILEQAPDVHLLCIGSVNDPAYYEKVLKEISLQKLQDRITIIPGLPYESQEMINAYRAADIFVLPSLYERYGMDVLEAWAAGLPVAAAKRGAPGYLVEHGKTGMLFDPEAPARFSESVKNALITLALDQESRGQYARAGHRKASETYSWEKITERLLDLYREVSGHSS